MIWNKLTGKIIFSCICGLILSITTQAQSLTPADTSRKIIQFSGVVVENDSLYPLGYVAVVIRNSSRGVYSNMNGYYSIVAQEHDTIDFFALGYRRASFILPDTFKTTNQYNHVQSLRVDTIFLHEAVIYPWPSKDEFKDAFLAMNIPVDDLSRARTNLSPAEMAKVAQTVTRDGGMAYNAAMRQQATQSASNGQYPTSNLLNPVAWAKFIQALNNGELKRQ